MSYREHAPPASLAGWVECLWTIRVPEEEASSVRVLPDGCADVIFDLGPRADGDPDRPPPWRSYAVGTMRSAKSYALPPGSDLIGVRMRPGATPALLDCDPAGLVDEVAGLADFWGGDAARLEEALLSAPTRARLVELGRALERRFDSDRADPLARRAFELARLSGGRASIRDLAHAVGRTPRTLERRFRAATGVTPKEACRVARFRRAVAVLERHPDLGGARLAARCGYADQSHLIREFRALGGTTPTEAVASRSVGYRDVDPGAARPAATPETASSKAVSPRCHGSHRSRSSR